LPTFLIIGLAEEEFIGQAVEGIDAFILVGEYVILRTVDVEDVLVVTVVLQDVVELAPAVWHELP
jgi:hypothetical protein